MLQLALCQARQHTIVIAIEDIHWIDKSSEEFLAMLADSLTGVPVLLVTTARPGYSPPWLGKSYAAQLALRVLTNDAATQIVEATVQRSPLHAALTQAIVEKAEGNPLFLEELTLAASTQNQLDVLRAMPNTIQGVLAARIDRLPEAAKRTLQAASVLGREFPLHLLQAICDSTAELPHHLTALKHEEFLFERPAATGTTLVFKHVLTQNVAYEGLLTARRQTLHEIAAQAVERNGAERLEEHYELLAHHYSRSANVEKAIDYLELANLKAIKANAAADAQIHFEAVLELYGKLPDTRENRRRRIATLLQQVPVYLLQLKLTQYEQLLYAHQPIAESIEDDGLLGRFYGCVGHAHWFMGRNDEGLDCERKAATLCEKAGEMAGAAFAYTLMQYLHWNKGDFGKTVELEAEATRVQAVAPASLRVHMWSLSISGRALGTMGQFDRGLEKCRLAMAAGEAASDPSIVCECLWKMAVILIDKGAVDNAAVHAKRAIELGPTTADKAWAQFALAWAMARMSPQTSVQLLEPLHRLFGSAQQGPMVAWVGCALGEAYLRAGDRTAAIHTLRSVVEQTHRSGMKHFEATAQRLLGEAGIDAEDADARAAAGGHFARALSLLQMCGSEPDIARTCIGLGELMLRQGKTRDAAGYLRRALEISQRLSMVGEPERAREIIERIPAA